jgi:hypothetical protein
MSVRSAHAWMRARPRMAAVGVVACIALSGGVAYAAIHPSSSSLQQRVLADAAKRLGVSPSALSGALKQAQIDQIEKAVADGRLTRAQANAIIARIRSGTVGLPVGPGEFGFGFPDHHVFGFRFRMGMGERGPEPGLLQAAATYLSLTPRALMTKLEGGKTLAQVATGEGRSVSDLEDAMVAAMKTRLDSAVKSRAMTSAQEQPMLAGIRSFVDRLVNGKLWQDRPGPGPGPWPSAGPAPSSAPAL